MNPRRVGHAVERGAQFLVQHAAMAGRIVAIEHQHLGNAGQAGAQRLHRKRPEQPHLQQADRLALIAHRIDRVARGAAHAAHRHDDDARAVAAVALDQRRSRGR